MLIITASEDRCPLGPDKATSEAFPTHQAAVALLEQRNMALVDPTQSLGEIEPGGAVHFRELSDLWGGHSNENELL